MEALLGRVRSVEGPLQGLVVPQGDLGRAGPRVAEAFGAARPSRLERVVLLASPPPGSPARIAARLLRPARLETPLGKARMDANALDLLAGYPCFAIEADGGAVAPLAAQLPFVQRLWPEAGVVAVLVGPAEARALAAVARALVDVLDEGTLVVAAFGPGHSEPLAGRPDVLVGTAEAEAVAALVGRDAAGFAGWREALAHACGLDAVEVLLRALGPGPAERLGDPDAPFPAVRFGGRFPAVADLSPEDRVALGAIAEEAVTAAVERRDPSLPVELSPRLRQRGGAFVSIHLDGQLKGCMGRLDSDSLALSVALAGRMAASNDPRFPSLGPEELGRADLEVSVLGALKPVQEPEDWEPGRHGLVLTRGFHRALLLPQVAVSHGMDREQFLEALSEKAGLPPDGWRGARLDRFGVQAFEPRARSAPAG